VRFTAALRGTAHSWAAAGMPSVEHVSTTHPPDQEQVMSYIISDESGTSGAVHQRDAWGWPREERPTYRTQAAPTFPRTTTTTAFPVWS
jgi:hypothetical protein